MRRPKPRWTTTRIDADAYRKGKTGGKRVLHLGGNHWLDVDAIEAYYNEPINEVLLQFLMAKFGIRDGCS